MLQEARQHVGEGGGPWGGQPSGEGQQGFRESGTWDARWLLGKGAAGTVGAGPGGGQSGKARLLCSLLCLGTSFCCDVKGRPWLLCCCGEDGAVSV